MRLFFAFLACFGWFTTIQAQPSKAASRPSLRRARTSPADGNLPVSSLFSTDVSHHNWRRRPAVALESM